jgi:SAM-dependent methyltransferase
LLSFPSASSKGKNEVVREINLLASLPKPSRDVKYRAKEKTPDVVKIAKQFGKSYFDGTREQGYGGYKYDGRWRSVARDIVKFFNLKRGMKVLDVGCAKGFLVYDLMQEGKMLDVVGIDISRYAMENCLPQVAHRIYLAGANHIPFPDKYFDLVLSINTLHNLPRDKCIKALQEIERVGKAAYVVVDSYHTPEEKELFQQWVLTAETYGYPQEWLEIFKEAGYGGYYGWNLM